MTARSPGRPRRIDALVAVSILDDAARFHAHVTEALRAREVRVWTSDGAEWSPVGDGPAAPPPEVRAAAARGGPVAAGDTTAWVAAPCARTPGDAPVGILAALVDAVDADDALVGLELLATRLAVELTWLRIHRRLVAEHERLRATAMMDPLTGGWTRAAFERTFEIELAGARRRGEALSMLLFDIDGLRRVNDVHGHAVGDAVLAHVAAVIRANVRVNDELARFGDDELAVLLMNAPADQATMVAEKLIRKVADAPLIVGGRTISFSVRVGVTGIDPDRERTHDAPFARAVQACDDASALRSRVAACHDSGVLPAVDVLDEDAQIGTPIGATLGGGYRIVHEISRGASGVVYRGEDLGLGRPVAIKVLRHDLGRDRELIARFRREASILASLRHPNLVEVYAFGADDEVYFVMELVEGPTAADVLEEAANRGEWLDVEAVAELIAEIGDALEAMHAAGLVHCDVKPENIVLDRKAGRAVLLDVGESKKGDEARRRAGTPGYAPPEMFSDGDETAAIDVYSLAATAYTLLTAQLPFGAGDALAILARQLDAPAAAPSSLRAGLPAAVDVVLAKAMDVDPARRYATPGALAIALRAALRGTTGERAAAIPVPGQLRELTVHPGAEPEEPAPAARALIRGAAFRVALKVLAARVGEPWLRRIGELRRDLADVLSPTLAPMSWHPLDQLIELVAAATGEIDLGDVMRTVGRGLVSVTFGHLYGADPAAMSTHGLLQSMPSVWPRYFGFGGCEVLGAGDCRVVIGVTGACVAPNSADLVAGVLERVAELTGAEEVSVQVTPTTDQTTFTVEWTE